MWALEIGWVTQVLEASVIEGTYTYPVSCLGVSGFEYFLCGPYFHICQSPNLLNCFGQVMHVLGIKIALIFPICTSVLPVFLVQSLEVWHSPEAFDCEGCSALTGLIACWGDVQSSSHHLTFRAAY